jgi:hypothetical protein
LACKKKLYAFNPKKPPQTLLVQRTSKYQRKEKCDPPNLERQVRQLLADKVSGNQVGIWLLIPEHMRLGTWDLLRGWSDSAPEKIEPRLALQITNEAALCHSNLRCGRTLSQKGFELANGLPFVGSDQAIHDLLNSRTVAGAQRLQAAVGLQELLHDFLDGFARQLSRMPADIAAGGLQERGPAQELGRLRILVAGAPENGGHGENCWMLHMDVCLTRSGLLHSGSTERNIAAETVE